MFRKIITVFLLISFLHFVGCYSTETISIKKIKEGTEQIDFGKDIKIVTTEYNSYNFPAYNYQINNDTLYGNGTQIVFGNEIPFNGKIAMSDISSIKHEEVDAGATSGLIITLVVIGAIGVVLVLAISFASALNPDK